jgi:thiol-disulfide isomerase/thioredoxin
MKSKLTKQNILIVIVIALLLIPQTRQSIQIVLHKGLSFINQSTIIDKEERQKISYENWQLISDNGDRLNLSDLKGEVIFINFWATWCPPCIVEMKSLDQLYNDFNESVVFLYITNDDLETVQKFKDKNSYSFGVYNPINKIPDELVTKSIPRTFILNKKGEIVVDEKGAINWYSDKVKAQLYQLLKE